MRHMYWNDEHIGEVWGDECDIYIGVISII